MDANIHGKKCDLCCAPIPICRLPIVLRRVLQRGQDAQHQAKLEGTNDARTGMPHGIPRGAMCVQRFDDSLNSAIHTTYRISLRSSSMPEPRDPLLKVLTYSVQKTQRGHDNQELGFLRRAPREGPGGRGPEAGPPAEATV